MKTIKNTPNHILPLGKMSAGQMGITLFLCFLFLTACKKDQPKLTEFNKDCGCATEVSADFTMEDLAGLPDHLFQYRTETDTAYENWSVYFEAKDSNAEYTWYIGSEIIHERSFIRQMTGLQLIGLQLPMSLVVKKEPNSICLPNDDGYDSITKYLTLVDFENYNYYHDYNHLFEGTFRFKNMLKPNEDSIDVEIQLKAGDEDNGNGLRRAILYGLWHNNTDLVLVEWYINYRQLWFQSGKGYSVQRMHHGMGGKVEIELKALEGLNNPPLEYHLIGRKII